MMIGTAIPPRLRTPLHFAHQIRFSNRRSSHHKYKLHFTFMSASEAVVSSPVASQQEGASDLGPLVQHIVVRKDLVEVQSWPLGSIIAQGCHASVAAVWENQADDLVVKYCQDIDRMHKVVLEVKGETQLRNLSEKLKEAGIIHKLWVEQPENFPTCLATKPYYKTDVAPFFKKLKLCK